MTPFITNRPSAHAPASGRNCHIPYGLYICPDGAQVLHDRNYVPTHWRPGDGVQLRENPNLQTAYRAAVEDRADTLADDIIALADSEPPAHLEGPALSAWVQQLKLRIHAREWTAAKLRPRVYGEKIDVSVQHTQISVLAALERAEQRVIGLA